MKSLQDPACGGLRTASAATDSLRVSRRARRSSRAPRAVVAKASTPAAATPAKQALGAPSKSSPAAATTAPPSGSKPTPANLLSSLPAVLPLPAPLPAVRTTHALGAGVLALFAALLISRLGRARGSVDGLVDRGVGLSDDRNVDSDRFYKGVMSGMRTSPAPELSDEAIEAARARRRMTVGDGDQMPTAGQELTAAAVPTNHPWATSKNRLTPEQEEAKRQEVLRLNRVTTRRSANGNGGQQ